MVLELNAKHDEILGIAHLSLAESKLLLEAAKERGVNKIPLTHPFFRVPAGMTVDSIKEMVCLGAMAEFGYCAISPMRAYVNREFTREVIGQVGYDNCLVMSDTGQSYNPMPPEAVWLYAQGLYERSVSPDIADKLTRSAPKAMVGL